MNPSTKTTQILAGVAAGLTICIATFAIFAPSRPVQAQQPVAKGTYTYLDQGWDAGMRDAWHTTSQGSLMMPYDWWFALESESGGKQFKDTLARFGILPGPSSKINPDSLPFGFVRGDYDREYNGISTRSWIGPTCSACHTSAIKVKKPGDSAESTLIVDGGQNNLDWGAFRAAMTVVISKTNSDSARFDRFARRLLAKTGDTAENRAKLRREFALYTAQMEKERRTDVPVHPWGPGRIDAFGAIFNRVSMILLGVPGNQAVTDAPVSIPFIWNLHRQDHMQWHGQTVNTREADRLGRNAGEVLGTYGMLSVDPSKPVYTSSIDSPNLAAMEAWLGDLKAPRWPQDMLGKIDPAAAMRGKSLYDKSCVSCHAVLSEDKTQVAKIIPVPLLEIGTDPKMTTNFHTRYAQTGALQGQIMFPSNTAKFGPTARMMDIMNHLATRWDVNTKANVKIEPYTPLEVDLPAFQNNFNNWGYEARPLHGIWATAPYLHNGSVSSLYQLLLPPAQRLKTFYVGTLSFDPLEVGYETDAKYGGHLFDTSLPGNRNSGHEYGTQLSDAERRDLIEYLKTL